LILFAPKTGAKRIVPKIGAMKNPRLSIHSTEHMKLRQLPVPKQIKKVYHERHGDGVICYTSSPYIDEPFAVVAFIFATRIDTLQVPQSS
ncbi:hypothetical protein KKB_10874, partial [Kingella kingae PYKK081]